MGFIILKLLIGKMASKEASALSALSTMNSAAHTPLLCSTMTVSISLPRNSLLSSRPQETLSSHTGQCSSPRHSRAKTLEISSPKSPLLVDQEEPPQQVQLLVVMTLQRRKKRKKRRLTSIWEVFSVKRTITELSKIISHIKTT